MELFDRVAKLIPVLKGHKSFALKQARAKGNKIVLEFESLLAGEFPPYFITVAYEKDKLSELSFSFILPKKIPSSARGWSLYLTILQYNRLGILAHLIREQDKWGLQSNIFTHDGLCGPPVWIVSDLIDEVKKNPLKQLSANRKKEIFNTLDLAQDLIEKDAAGKFIVYSLDDSSVL